jgi:hypothetical protein
MNNNKYIVGLFDDEVTLLHAIKKIRQKGLKIDDVLTPFPIHGIDDVLGLKESRLHTVGFLVGTCGLLFAISFMIWVNTVNYPLDFGGKPYLSIPSFIPITFEFTVLTASVSMVLAFLARNGLYPGKQPRIFDERITDDMFAITFAIDNASDAQIEKITDALGEAGVVEIKKKDFNDSEY